MSTSTTPYIRPTEIELALGVRNQSHPAVSSPFGDKTARSVIEDEIADWLDTGPTFVSFSGGRDSSAILAVAADVAKRRGLHPPRPVILRYPGDRESDETVWQDLVLGHLGIADPVVLNITERMTYLDSTVQANLRRRGLLFPAALQLDDPILPLATGGTLLTGEGGDEILGTRRITPFTLLLRLNRRPSRTLLRWAWESAEPTRAHARRELRSETAAIHWSTPRAHELLLNELVSDHRHPLHWGKETEMLAQGRVPEVLAHNFQLVADEYSVQVRHPLQSPAFAAALAWEGGRWGFAGRTALMRHLFSDLLPDAVLARSTKAHFGGVRWGGAERAFARRWDGGGLPADLLDVEALRSEWLSDRPSGASVLALHAAWLHSEGLTWEGTAHG